MPFEILNLTAATMVSLTSRTERHGKEDVSAMSFRLRFSGPNTMLDMLSADVRKTLYMAAEGQEDLPGVEPTTPLLRCKAVKTWAPEITYEGWTVTVDYGIDESSQIVMGSCKVDAFTAELFDGGTVAIECRVSTSDLDWMGAGRLWSLQKRELQVMLAAPLTTQTNPEAGEQDERQLTLDAQGNEVREPSPERLAAEAAFSDPGAEGMDPNAMRAFPDAVDGEDDGQDAGEHVAGDVERNGADATAKTPAQIRAAKAAATRRAKAAA